MSEINTLHTATSRAAEPAIAAPVPPSRPEPSRTQSDIDAEVRRESALPLPRMSGVATFRDEKTGRLVIQIFHAPTGQVIAQFPSVLQLDSYPSAPKAGGRPNLNIAT